MEVKTTDYPRSKGKAEESKACAVHMLNSQTHYVDFKCADATAVQMIDLSSKMDHVYPSCVKYKHVVAPESWAES